MPVELLKLETQKIKESSDELVNAASAFDN
jgi:hypothetical protein